MIEALHMPFRHYLGKHRACVLIGCGRDAPVPILVPYREHWPYLDCLLPRWADIAYHLEQDPRVILVIPTVERDDFWLELRAIAQLINALEWFELLPDPSGPISPEELYSVIRVQPYRLDLYDGQRGWGARETLELAQAPAEQ